MQVENSHEGGEIKSGIPLRAREERTGDGGAARVIRETRFRIEL